MHEEKWKWLEEDGIELRLIGNPHPPFSVVYVSGPYSSGDVATNVGRAATIGVTLMDVGLTPVIPHMSHFTHMWLPRPYRDWICADVRLLLRCDCILNFAPRSPSDGRDFEIAVARKVGLPVFTKVSMILAENSCGELR